MEPGELVHSLSSSWGWGTLHLFDCQVNTGESEEYCDGCTSWCTKKGMWRGGAAVTLSLVSAEDPALALHAVTRVK